MEYMDIINLTYELLDTYKASDTFKRLKVLNDIIKEKYAKEIDTYQKAFKQFDEAFPLKDYYPDFKAISQTYQQAKITLFEKEEVIEYFRLETIINDQLKELSDGLNHIVPKEISCAK